MLNVLEDDDVLVVDVDVLVDGSTVKLTVTVLPPSLKQPSSK